MTVRLLSPGEVVALQSASLTYSEVGATRSDRSEQLPGYRQLRRSRRLAAGTTWASATQALLRWQVPDRAGLRVRASALVIEPGSVGELSFGLGPAAFRAPVRVVYLDQEADHCAFAYGTLPRHPEIGEEAFALDRAADGHILFTITAFSRPGTLATRVAGPLGALVQSAVTWRYLRSL